jgi:hypothetical protein
MRSLLPNRSLYVSPKKRQSIKQRYISTLKHTKEPDNYPLVKNGCVFVPRPLTGGDFFFAKVPAIILNVYLNGGAAGYVSNWLARLHFSHSLGTLTFSGGKKLMKGAANWVQLSECHPS